MPPVTRQTRRYALHPDGSPARALEDAVASTYIVKQRFFEDVAKAVARSHHNGDTDLVAKPGSVKRTYLRFIAGDGALPAPQREAYLRLLSIDEGILDAIDGTRLSPMQVRAAGLLATVEVLSARVEELERIVAEQLMRQSDLNEQLVQNAAETSR